MTNYLYNGVRLPVLPEWDKTAYPYAYIEQNYYYGTPTDTYFLFVSSTQGVEKDGGWLGDSVLEFGTDTAFSYTIENGAWVRNGDTAEIDMCIFVDNLGRKVGELTWTNTDTYREDGTLYLPASDPIPVLNPTAILMGYSMGGRL